MNKTDFKIIFDSNNHEVDIETLIGNLMHTSNIVQEVNRSLKTDKKIEVKIKALEKGSFEIHIELVEKLIASLFSNEAVSYGSNIVGVVGGLYAFAKFLGGSKPKEVKKQEDKTFVTNKNGDTTVIHGDVYNIFNENKNVRNSIAKQFQVLDNNDEISGFKFESKTEKTHIQKQEFKAISTKLDALDEVNEKPLSEVIKDKKLFILRPSFSKDLKWDFIYEGQKIAAKMDDESILEAIDNGEKFAKGDYMVADIEVTKFYDSDYDLHMITKDSYKILRYKEHIKSDKQGKLF